MATTLCVPVEGGIPTKAKGFLLPDRNPSKVALNMSGGIPHYQPYAITSLSDSNEIVALLFSNKVSISCIMPRTTHICAPH